MKRLISIILCVSLVATLAACGGGNSGNNANNNGGGGEEQAAPYLITEGVLQVALEPEYPPMEFKEGDELTGFDVEMIKAIGEELGLEIVFREVGWDGIFLGLEGKQYDIICSSVSITQQRIDDKKMSFTDPYMNNGQYIIINKDATDIVQLSDLEGMKVGVQSATTADEACRKYLETPGSVQYTLQPYDAVNVTLLALEAGQLDAVVCDAVVAMAFVNSSDKFAISTAKMTNEPIAIAVGYGNEELISRLNEAIAAIKAKGVLSELSIKYVEVDITEDIDTVLK
ncbi:MAG: transporter substrate-binding domain-containing protein [Eubacteriaceae bacterium]|nr:transporter substrate-binding domain-containing protein [Eubacteriaceae bacterium]